MDPIASLEIVERTLDRLRFVGTDQNPEGIRDLLSSAIFKLKRERAAQTEFERKLAASLDEPIVCPTDLTEDKL